MTEQEMKELKERFISALTLIPRKGMQNVLDWLEASDFYTAPASTRYHGSYEGGLLQHSWNVYRILRDMVTSLSPKTIGNQTISLDTVAITALLHDICKANTYKKAQKWRKDSNNRWEQYDVYEFKEDEPLGHGEKSIYILQRAGLELTEQEVYMIRWHMGGFDESKMALQSAMAKCPEIAMLHSADLIATHMAERRQQDGSK